MRAYWEDMANCFRRGEWVAGCLMLAYFPFVVLLILISGDHDG